MTEKEQLLTAELERAQKRTARLETAFKKSLETRAAAAIRDAGGEPSLLLPAVMRDVKIFEDGEDFVVGVADKGGGKRIRDVKGTPFTIEELVGEMKSSPDYVWAFGPAEPAAPHGGQDFSKPSAVERLKAARQADNTKSRADFDQMTPADKMVFMKGGGRVL